jgi:dUTPase
MSVNLAYSKVREVNSPVRGTSLSAGVDFFVPVLSEDFQKVLREKNPTIQFWTTNEDKWIILNPHERILIPSGIHLNLLEVGSKISATLEEAGIAFIAHNKSGVGSKLGLDRLAEVVDEDYQGEVHISIVNTGNVPVNIKENDKLIQFILIPVLYTKLIELPFDKLYSVKTERAGGGFGSTDKTTNDPGSF